MSFLKTYGLAFVIFFAIDLFWLVFVANRFYKESIGHLMADQTNWPAALIFYILFIGGLVFFAIQPGLERNSWTYALMAGALFGLMTYATYDLTNLATLRDWPLKMTIIDLIWGTSLNGLTAALTTLLMQHLK